MIDDNQILEDLKHEYKLTDLQAEWVLLVLGGEKPLEATTQIYNYTNKTNAYGQLAALIQNKKIDVALKSMGFNLKDTQEKQAFGIVRALHEIAFDEGTSNKDRLSALKELAKYNPVLLGIQKSRITDEDEARIVDELQYFYRDTEEVHGDVPEGVVEDVGPATQDESGSHSSSANTLEKK